ncbi:hypothetical protein EV361DRAFT_868954 [Lentinula raphanica]|nr:hypothetical protein EV361DRAFT_868954 [Lentinula raphanica]
MTQGLEIFVVTSIVNSSKNILNGHSIPIPTPSTIPSWVSQKVSANKDAQSLSLAAALQAYYEACFLAADNVHRKVTRSSIPWSHQSQLSDLFQIAGGNSLRTKLLVLSRELGKERLNLRTLSYIDINRRTFHWGLGLEVKFAGERDENHSRGLQDVKKRFSKSFRHQVCSELPLEIRSSQPLGGVNHFSRSPKALPFSLSPAPIASPPSVRTQTQEHGGTKSVGHCAEQVRRMRSEAFITGCESIREIVPAETSIKFLKLHLRGPLDSPLLFRHAPRLPTSHKHVWEFLARLPLRRPTLEVLYRKIRPHLEDRGYGLLLDGKGERSRKAIGVRLEEDK